MNGKAPRTAHPALERKGRELTRWLCGPVLDTPQIHRCGLGIEPPMLMA